MSDTPTETPEAPGPAPSPPSAPDPAPEPAPAPDGGPAPASEPGAGPATADLVAALKRALTGPGEGWHHSRRALLAELDKLA